MSEIHVIILLKETQWIFIVVVSNVNYKRDKVLAISEVITLRDWLSCLLKNSSSNWNFLVKVIKIRTCWF